MMCKEANPSSPLFQMGDVLDIFDNTMVIEGEYYAEGISFRV